MKAFVHASMVAVDKDFNLYEDGMMLVDGDKIQYVGPYDASRLDQVEQVLDYRGCWILPGLINTHTHSAMALLRGIEDDSNLYEWLENYIWPAEADFSPEDTTLAVKVALVEMLQSGTTTFNDMYNPSGVDIEKVHEVVAASKMRAFFSPTLFSSERETSQETLDRTRGILEQALSFEDPKFKVMVAPHAPYSCSRELLEGALEVAKELDLPLHIHVAETPEETALIIERTGKRPIAYMQELGYLDHPAVFAHGLDLDDEEIQFLAASKAGVAHNPISNLKLASGVARVTDLIEAGVTVGMATDSTASNNNLDLFEETRTAALLQKARLRDARDFPIEMALRSMTIESAKLLGLDDQIGSLEVGKQADFLVIDPRNKIHLYPLENMLSHLVYALKGSDVTDVYIGGERVVEAGKVLSLDQDVLFKELAERKQG